MKRVVGLMLCLGLLLAVPVRTQEKPKPAQSDSPKVVAQLRVTVVFSEFEGEKKISSFPYTLLVNAYDRGRSVSNIRMGLRVPIITTGNQFQYMDVGTDIDCSAEPQEDGRFNLPILVRRSSIYSSGPEKKSIDWSPGDPPLAAQPIVRQFSGQVNLLARDGQTIQTTVATDPISGRTLKVDVTVNVLK